MSGRNTLLRNARFVRLPTCLNKLIHVHLYLSFRSVIPHHHMPYMRISLPQQAIQQKQPHKMFFEITKVAHCSDRCNRYHRSVCVIVRCLVLKQPDCMSLIVEASSHVMDRCCDNLAEGSITPDVGTRQAVVVCRVCALCCLCTAVIWLFENLHNSVVLAPLTALEQSSLVTCL